MDEAQQLCDRIGIVDRGRRIALGTPQELIRTLGAEHFVTAEVEDPAATITTASLLALPDVVAAERDGRELRLTVRSVHTALPALLALLARHAVPLHGLATRSATLEDVFVHLTGRHLREDAA
jgi:ABC-2 type transport system ATP-binding protein